MINQSLEYLLFNIGSHTLADFLLQTLLDFSLHLFNIAIFNAKGTGKISIQCWQYRLFNSHKRYIIRHCFTSQLLRFVVCWVADFKGFISVSFISNKIFIKLSDATALT